MKVLLLGGTSDARKVVTALEQSCLLQTSNRPAGKIQLIYSVAGLVRVPELACEVISGGFTQFGGLARYIDKNNIDAMLDVTHPFAAKMSNTAVQVAGEIGIPCWRFHRPAWQAEAGDNWQSFQDWPELIPELQGKRSVLITAGQLEQKIMDQLVQQARDQQPAQKLILRTAAAPRTELPDDLEWIKAIGPFNQADELALLQQYQVDLLISKNSGGAATEAKLTAARQLGIAVLMLERPEFARADQQFSTLSECVDWLTNAVERTT